MDVDTISTFLLDHAAEAEDHDTHEDEQATPQALSSQTVLDVVFVELDVLATAAAVEFMERSHVVEDIAEVKSMELRDCDKLDVVSTSSVVVPWMPCMMMSPIGTVDVELFWAAT